MSEELAQVTVELTSATDSISELFSRDPITWSDKQLVEAVKHLREQRVKLIALESKPKAEKATKIPVEELKAMGGDDLAGLLGI